MDDSIDFHALQVGDPLPPDTKGPLTRSQFVRYAGASGDFNPLHTDEDVARSSGLKTVIAQGPLIMGLVGQAIVRWAPKGSLRRFRVRFCGMSYPGDTITVTAAIAGKRRTGESLEVVCDTQAQDQRGGLKLTGQFELLIPVRRGDTGDET